jgi:anti-sigma-K factor RskA
VSGHEQTARPPDCGRDAAPYLLGALDPPEARAFVRHLQRCAVCRDEVTTLAPVLDALPASARAHPVPRTLRRRVLRQVKAEPKVTAVRRRRRIRALVHSAPAGWLALGATMAAAAVVVQIGTPRPAQRSVTATVGQAQLRVSGGHGELIVDRLPPLPSNRTYELWVQRGGHRPAPSALFGVAPQGTADVGVPTDLHDVTRLLVTVEPRGGSLVPTTRPVIRIALIRVPTHTTPT